MCCVIDQPEKHLHNTATSTKLSFQRSMHKTPTCNDSSAPSSEIPVRLLNDPHHSVEFAKGIGNQVEVISTTNPHLNPCRVILHA